ncbi:hypothetical protein JOD54_003849 [Actinokineospora baliensis]|uniref:DUF2306 domain-containing protein n=1 Tax=Actinokineospora baliensis TaxID=547056 RepID=UPI00195947AB|nr:DUF2306 domain-containing protein [Actinokineospora baliensis]MBM7773645.1 hypothetical protein [Actinokineospora baliensis]
MIRAPWAIPVAALITVFLVFSLPPYLTFDPAQSRVPAGFAFHYPALLTHITFGAVAMVAGFLQVWPWFRRHHRHRHALIGRVYVFGGVLPAAAAGLVVGVTSPFGPVARVSHVLLATLWLVSTVMGYRRARAKDFEAHRVWVVRSYVLTLSTITNRLWGPLVALVLTPGLDTTFGGSEVAMVQAIAGITSWLGWTIPLLAVEWFAHRRGRVAR